MSPLQKDEVAQSPEVQDARYQLAAAGIKDQIINDTINHALDGIGNPGYREGVRIVTRCLLQKLQAYEADHQPKTWFGHLTKWIFG